MPLLTYWGWYRGEHPNIRGIDFGHLSVSSGKASSLEVAFARKYLEPTPDEYEDYSFLEVD